MATLPRTLRRLRPAVSSSALLALLALLLPAAGCKGLVNAFYQKPNEANIELRKKNQDLEEKLAEAQKQHETDQSLIQSLRQSRPATAVLPADRVAKLYTTRDLKFGRLTGDYDAGPARPGESGVKVYLVPTDQDGQPLKAAGSFVIEAFDLDQPQAPLLGRWTFDTDEAKRNWYGSFMDYTYAFTLPWKTWQKPPGHPEVTIKVAFTDALTGLTFQKQMPITIHVPPTSPPSAGPTSRPATAP